MARTFQDLDGIGREPIRESVAIVLPNCGEVTLGSGVVTVVPEFEIQDMKHLSRVR